MTIATVNASISGEALRPGVRKPSVCFVAPTNYGLLSGREDLRHIGGAEVQRVIIARGLIARGYDVSFVTADHGQPDGIEHDGIRVFKMCPPTAGVPGIRFIHPRWTSLWSAMARADAEVYYQRTAGIESGQVAMWCARRGRRFVLATANDSHCDRHRYRPRELRERWLYYYALRRADAIVVQTEAQRRTLLETFGRDARLIRSCAPEPEATPATCGVAERLATPRILWVGRSASLKRPELVLELARVCPDCQFDVVGIPGPADDRSSDVIGALSATPNVTLHGYVPHHRVGAYYDRAAVLMSTSLSEGFPNTFLEAWSRGVPVLSTIDPDGVIRSHGLGIQAGSLESLRDAIRVLLASPEHWSEVSIRVRRYFSENHTVQAASDAYEHLLMDLAALHRNV